MFQVFVLLALPFWTSAYSCKGDKNVQKQVKILQNTVNELRDLVHVQKQRNDFLELEIVKTRNEMEQMKEIHRYETRNLDSRVSNLELIEAKYNRVLKTLKRNYGYQEIRLSSKLPSMETGEDTYGDDGSSTGTEKSF